MDLEQLDDSYLPQKQFGHFITSLLEKGDHFKAAMAFQDIVQSRFQYFYLQLYADNILNNGRVSDSSVKIAKEVEKDLNFYNK